tara:strand:+ start:590 stop:796 length:207 start_codon:yes stop_codon:yes gene_type:complete
MPDEITNRAKSAVSPINNGGIVTFVRETGQYVAASGSMINKFVPSGTLQTRYEDRFDDVRYYTGDTSD